MKIPRLRPPKSMADSARNDNVEVTFRKKITGVSAVWVRQVISKTFALEKSKINSVSVLITGDREIRRINKKYLNHDYATDVISFGLQNTCHSEATKSPKNLVFKDEILRFAQDDIYLGDVVVSVDTAKSFAKKLDISFKEELARYLVHGTLHLLGYDDCDKKSFEKMHSRQEEILKRLAGGAGGMLGRATARPSVRRKPGPASRARSL